MTGYPLFIWSHFRFLLYAFGRLHTRTLPEVYRPQDAEHDCKLRSLSNISFKGLFFSPQKYHWCFFLPFFQITCSLCMKTSERHKSASPSKIIIIIGIQPLGRSGQRPELSRATGVALVCCILGKFLGVVCHCFPLPSKTRRERQRHSFDTEDNLDIINLPALRLENRKLRNVAQNIVQHLNLFTIYL